MKTIRAVYEGGAIRLLEPVTMPGRHQAVVVVEEELLEAPGGEDVDDAPWKRILRDPTPRPDFDAFMHEAEAEIAAGETQPLELEQA